MHSILFIVSLAFASITAEDVDHIPMGKHGRTYPSKTIYDKDGQYIRLIGPLYAKIDLTGVKFPLQYWRKMNITLAVTPTLELSSLFYSGDIKFEGSTLYHPDPYIDICITGGMDCPFLPGVRVHKEVSFTFGDFGLFPGWYESNIDILTTDSKHQRFRVLRLEFKVKVLET